MLSRSAESTHTKEILSPVNILWIARYDYEQEWSTEPHAHDFFQLIRILDGRGSAVIGEEKVILECQEVIIIPPRVTHQFIADQGISLKTLDTKFEALDLGFSKALSQLVRVTNDPNNAIRDVLERIRLEGSRRLSWYRYLCNALLTECLVSLLGETVRASDTSRPYSAATEEDVAVYLAKNFMDVHFAEDIDSSTISMHVGYSPEYLSKKFKQTLGISLHACLTHVRIRKAQEMLAYEEISIKEVAFLVGFKTIHHFSRVFKEISGTPPATWRDRERAGIWQNVVIAPGFTNTDRTIKCEPACEK